MYPAGVVSFRFVACDGVNCRRSCRWALALRVQVCNPQSYSFSMFLVDGHVIHSEVDDRCDSSQVDVSVLVFVGSLQGLVAEGHPIRDPTD